MKNEKLKTEVVHFVQFVNACGEKTFFRLFQLFFSTKALKNLSEGRSFHFSFFVLRFSFLIYKVRRTQLPFFILRF